MKRRIEIKFIVLLAFFAAAGEVRAQSQEVIDLGSIKVEGAPRGPEINVIEPGMDEETAGKILMREISKLEAPLLASDLVPTKATPGGRR